MSNKNSIAVGGSQWGSNPPRHSVPHIGFEVRARHRPGLASVRDCSVAVVGPARQLTRGVGRMALVRSLLFPIV